MVTNLAMIPWIYYSYHFVKKIEAEAPSDYQFPSIWDFRMTAVSGIVFTVSQIVLRKLCYVLF